MSAGRRIELTGTVQGVGFRPFVYRLASQRGISGRVRNDPAGVVIEVFGAAAVLDDFLEQLRTTLPPAAELRTVRWVSLEGDAPAGFSIEPSGGAAERRVAVPADLAVCEECLGEVRDPSDRRFRYPFTNCTSCGPRYTILLDLPYDRAATTMARFTMCPACQAEYASPGDRRFHAEPNACPVCGPQLWIMGHSGGDSLETAAAALRAGKIVAVKGLGGFHLACDATSVAAVARLRERKRREEKPFAVMVADLAAAEDLAEIDPEERRLLVSVERPIVLVRRRPGGSLAAGVAPDNPLVGVLIAYTPLHHLLLEAVGRPLVMTSGNLSDEPITARNEDAADRLSGIADLVLAHDRDIETPCDDSVARVVAGQPMILRRARGYVPRSIPVKRRSAAPILACGAQLKNTVCLLTGDAAVLGPHVGDLDGLETWRHYAKHIELLERLVGVRPEVLAHDLHPDYLSTAYAQSRPAARRIAVQHHHAHVVSVMAEHGMAGRVLGLAWDGTGLGTDGAAWGGELLLCEAARFERLATFRPLALVGGDQAVREPWRQALAALEDAFEGQAPLARFPVFRGVDTGKLEAVRKLLADDDTPRVHGAGRWFDALGALALGKARSAYEGQVPMAFSLLADPAELRAYPYAIDDAAAPWQLDLRPTVRAFAEDLLRGEPAGVVAARFHNTLIAAGADLVARAFARHGRFPVVLTGGCFQNAALAKGLVSALGADRVLLPQVVPPGDGGIALGQALVADAVLAGG